MHHGHRRNVASRLPAPAISDNDAQLTVEGSIQGLNLKEFLLLPSSTGLAYRRCELIRVNGTDMDIQFLKTKSRKKKQASSPALMAKLKFRSLLEQAL